MFVILILRNILCLCLRKRERGIRGGKPKIGFPFSVYLSANFKATNLINTPSNHQVQIHRTTS